EWKTPQNVHDIQVFLGFANFYRRFIKNFSKVVAPITKLLKKDIPFIWDQAAKEAFESLKKAFTSDPILKHFDPYKPCYIETDASKDAIGAICSQKDENDILHPIAFYSRSLTPAERNYHIHDQELLAIVEAFEHWRHYLIYSEHVTKVFTDHKNLLYFTTKQNLNSRQVRWSRILQNYNFEIEDRPGNKNQAADALSRKDLKGGEDPSNSTPILKKIINLDALDTDDEDESYDEPLIDRRFPPTPEAPIHTGSPDIGS